MTRVAFVIPGRPVAKGRPRYDSTTRRTYTPAATEEAEATLAGYVVIGMQRAGLRVPFDEPLGVRLTFVMPTRQRVDLDNLGKLVLDSLNDVLWADDSLIEHLEMFRVVERNAPGRTRIEVWTNPTGPGG